MKIEQVIKVLAAHANILEAAGAHVQAEALRAIDVALEPVKSDSVKAAGGKIVKFAQRQSGFQGLAGEPLIGSVLPQFVLLRDVLKAAGAKSAGDVAQLLEVLSPIANLPISALSEAWSVKPAASKRKSAAKPAVAIDPATIRDLADRLAAANGDDHKFKSIVAELRSQKLPNAAIYAIANRFLGIEAHRTYKSATIAFQRIEERHFQDAISASRERAINQINH